MSGSQGGLYGGDPVDSADLEKVAPSLVPSTAGEVAGATIGQAIADLPTVGLARLGRQALAGQSQFDPETGEYAAPEPNVPRDQLNRQYSVPATSTTPALTFDTDMPASVAQSLYDHRVAEIQRNDILNRNAGGILSGGLARFVEGSAVGLVDPLNIASMFVPGIPEARIAAVLGEEALGASGRALVRGLAGASQGAIGQVALQPLDYAIAKGNQDDYDMGTALSNVAFGGLFGGVLHAGFGALADLRGPLPEWSRRIADQPAPMQQAMFNGAVSAMAEERPVAVAGLMDIRDNLQALRDEQRAITEGTITEDYARGLMGYGPTDAPPDFGKDVEATGDNLRQLGEDTSKEHVRFFDAFTNETAEPDVITKQNQTRVGFAGDIADRLRGDNDSIVIQHNHPDENSLSPADITVSARPSAAAIVAHTPDDHIFIGKYNGSSAQAGRLWHHVLEKLRPLLKDRLDSGELTKEDYSPVGTDLVNRVLDYGGKMDYTSTRAVPEWGADAIETAGKEAFGDKGSVALDRATRTVSKQEALADIRGRAESLARTKRGSAFDDSRRAAYNEALAGRLNARAAEIAQRIQDLGRQAEAMANDNRGGLQPDMQRQIARNDATIAAADNITGDPVKDAAVWEKRSAEIQQAIQVEKAAGRWTDADDAALSSILDTEKEGEGDAKALTEAAACIAAGGFGGV